MERTKKNHLNSASLQGDGLSYFKSTPKGQRTCKGLQVWSKGTTDEETQPNDLNVTSQ